MKNFTVLTVIIFIFISLSLLNGQTKNKPLVVLDANLSYNQPLLESSGTIQDFWGLGKFGFTTAYGGNIGAKWSVYTQSMFQFRVYANAAYMQASASENQAYNVVATSNNIHNANTNEINVTTNWPGSNYMYPSITTGQSYIRYNVPSIAFGGEAVVYLDKNCKSSFNFDLDLNSSIITGRAYNTYPDGEVYYTIPMNVRFGFGANVVYNLRLSEIIGLNVGSRFMFHNLVGKSIGNNDDNWYIPLNDGSGTIGSTNLPGRNMVTANFFAGCSFYLGKR